MSLATVKDIPLLINSTNAVSERRITPTWSISQLRTKMEPITGIPPSQQKLAILKASNNTRINIEASDEDATTLQSFPMEPYDTLIIEDLRPESARINYNDTSAVEKYEMDKEEYAKLNDSVLAWKKRNHLGRFDPTKSEHADSTVKAHEDLVESRKIVKGARCRVGDPSLERLGEVMYVGSVEQIPGGGIWVGIKFDEPVGKNNGSVGDVKYFEAPEKHGSFVRPDRVEVGDFPKKDITEDEDLYEEL